jgi:hypothetical protein
VPTRLIRGEVTRERIDSDGKYNIIIQDEKSNTVIHSICNQKYPGMIHLID